MTFWIRHLTLLVLCVVVPLGAALYVDTASEIARAKRAGETAAKLAANSVAQRLQLDAHKTVGEAMMLSRKIAEGSFDEDLVKGYGKKKDQALEKLKKLLGEGGAGGFAWLVSNEGTILLANGMSEVPESPRSIVGHPLYRKTQEGLAVDGLWEEGGKLSLVGAAPLIKDGRAEGALLVGRTIDPNMLRTFGEIGELTVVAGSNVVATTLEQTFAKSLVEPTANTSEPLHAGKLDKPLASGVLPFLPVLIDSHAEGLAYTSAVHAAPSGNVRWIVSVPSAGPLQDLARRQEILLGVLFASLMLALLVGLVNHRTFVSPIERVAEHLSAIQLGRGEAELPETRVSRPFRRLVRLINMMVQKMPTRAFTATPSLSEHSPISELPHPSTGDLLAPMRSEPRPPPKAITPLPDLAADVEPADISTFPAARTPKPAFSARDDEDAAVAEAIASMGLPPVQPREMEEEDQNADSAAAIAEAIASLEAQQSAAVDVGLSAPPAPKSAASIRGGIPKAAEMDSPFMPSQSEYLRAGSLTSPRPTAQQKFYLPPEDAVTTGGTGTGVRGGGSLNLGSAALADPSSFGPEETVVAPVQEDLLAKSARDEGTGEHSALNEAGKPDATVVASVPADLLAQSAGESIPEGPGDMHGLDAADHAHFKQVYERFIEMRRKCGEATADLAFDRFLTKLTKNRENLIKKYNCRTVRFQVYEKDGKAALKATPVRAR